MFGLTNGANRFKFGIPLHSRCLIHPLPLECPQLLFSLFCLARHHAVDLAQYERQGSSVAYLIVCIQTLNTTTISARLGGRQEVVRL